MSRFTPGPWLAQEYCDDDEGCSVIAVIEENGLRSPTRGQVAFCTSIGGASFESPGLCAANARLIAAAPDLLEALNRVLASQTIKNPDPENDSDVIFARAAIAKATPAAPKEPT